MAKAILMRGGPGGVGSDEVTAGREHVVKGHITVTADSNDEPIEGLIEDRGDGAVVSYLQGREDLNNRIWVLFKNGWYHRIPWDDGQGHIHEAFVYVTYEQIKNLFGIDGAKMLQGYSIAGVQGQIKSIDTAADNYNVNKSSAFGIDSAGRFYIDFPHGNAYYTRGDGHPHTCIDANKLGNAGADSVLQGQTATSEKGVKFTGTIKRWICNSGDVISANNNAGFAWDDNTGASRGRGIIVGIPNNHYIQGANWVFLSSPNLYPQNVAKGININGVTGTRDWVDRFTPTWISDSTLNLTVNTVEHEVHFPNKLLQYNGLFLKLIIWNATTDGYYKNSNGGICPCVLSIANWDGGATFAVKLGPYMLYGILERQGDGFNDFRLKYRGTANFNVSLNFLATQGFSHQWAGNYAT